MSTLSRARNVIMRVAITLVVFVLALAAPLFARASSSANTALGAGVIYVYDAHVTATTSVGKSAAGTLPVDGHVHVEDRIQRSSRQADEILGDEEAAALDEGEAAANDLEIADGNAGHMFREAPGHLAEDTAANRQLLRDTANNPANYVSTDSNGVATYHQTLADGRQAWAETYNGQITNGGVNDVP